MKKLNLFFLTSVSCSIVVCGCSSSSPEPVPHVNLPKLDAGRVDPPRVTNTDPSLPSPPPPPTEDSSTYTSTSSSQQYSPPTESRVERQPNTQQPLLDSTIKAGSRENASQNQQQQDGFNNAYAASRERDLQSQQKMDQDRFQQRQNEINSSSASDGMKKFQNDNAQRNYSNSQQQHAEDAQNDINFNNRTR